MSQPQPQQNPMFTEQLINRICCSLINRLLGALNCFSAPIADLHELDDGVILVELIETFEETMFVKLPATLPTPAERPALSRMASRTNMEYVEAWLKVEGINLDAKRSIREIFAEIRRSSQELASFLGSFNDNSSKGNSNDTTSLTSLLQSQKVAIYARSIAYISALCYAIFSIFLKHGTTFKRFIPGYSFQVAPDELLHILFYTKWKLTEEELLLKDLELMKRKDELDLLEIENRRLRDICGHYGMKREAAQQIVDQPVNGSVEVSVGVLPKPRTSLENRSSGTSTGGTTFKETQAILDKENSSDIESISSVTLSSIAEMKSVATLTDIFGLDNDLLVRYGFNKKIMEMKDQQIQEKIKERIQAEKAQIEQQRNHNTDQKQMESSMTNLNQTKPAPTTTVTSNHIQTPIEPKSPQITGQFETPQTSNVQTQIESNNSSSNSRDSFQYNKRQVELSLTGRQSNGSRLSTLHETSHEANYEPNYEVHYAQNQAPSRASPKLNSNPFESPEYRSQQSSTALKEDQALNELFDTANREGNKGLPWKERTFPTVWSPEIDRSKLTDERDTNKTTTTTKSTTHIVTSNSGVVHPGASEDANEEELRNRILIARLLAELSYEKNKNMKSLRQTNQDYI